MIFWRKGILLAIQHPLPSIGAELLQSILQELQGSPAKDLPTSLLHPNRPPALQHLYFCHLKPTDFHFQALQIHALMFLSSSSLPSQNNSGNCTSEICSASSAVLMPSGSSVAPQPFLLLLHCTNIASAPISQFSTL